MNKLLSATDTQAVLDILVEQLGVAAAELKPEAWLKQDLSADSLTIAEIVLALEEHFNLTIPDENVGDDITVGEIFAVLSAQLGKPVSRTAGGASRQPTVP